jgi:hypothetical protein
LRPCCGCGALVPDTDGPTHRYIGASPGCWAAYGEVLEKEYGDFRYSPSHGLTVDAYAAQHPGTPSPQSIRSVVVHLVALCLQLERGVRAEEVYAARKRVASLGERGDLAWLQPPASMGDATVLDVRSAGDTHEHAERAREWAASVWGVWSNHHETVRRWAGLDARFQR